VKLNVILPWIKLFDFLTKAIHMTFFTESFTESYTDVSVITFITWWGIQQFSVFQKLAYFFELWWTMWGSHVALRQEINTHNALALEFLRSTPAQNLHRKIILKQFVNT
jgi:hypothetical protein